MWYHPCGNPRSCYLLQCSTTISGTDNAPNAMLQHCHGSRKEIRHVDYKRMGLCLESSISLWEGCMLTWLVLLSFWDFMFCSSLSIPLLWKTSFKWVGSGENYLLGCWEEVDFLLEYLSNSFKFCGATYLARSKPKHTLLSYSFSVKIHILGCWNVYCTFSKLWS